MCRISIQSFGLAERRENPDLEPNDEDVASDADLRSSVDADAAGDDDDSDYISADKGSSYHPSDDAKEDAESQDLMSLGILFSILLLVFNCLAFSFGFSFYHFFFFFIYFLLFIFQSESFMIVIKWFWLR